MICRSTIPAGHLTMCGWGSQLTFRTGDYCYPRLAPGVHGCCAVRREDAHGVEDEAALIRHVDAPVLVGPDLPGVVLEKFPDEARDLNPQTFQIGARDVDRVPDPFVRPKLDVVIGHGNSPRQPKRVKRSGVPAQLGLARLVLQRLLQPLIFAVERCKHLPPQFALGGKASLGRPLPSMGFQ